MARPLVTCELTGRREHFIKGKTIKEIMRALGIQDMARSVLRGFKHSFFAWPSEQCLRDFLPSLLLVFFASSSPLDFSTHKCAVLCVNLKRLSIHQYLWIDVNSIQLGIDRTVLLRKG